MTSATRWALMHELRGAPELSLADAQRRQSPSDLVLVEGYKRSPIPKLESHRPDRGKPLLMPGDPHIVGLATDQPKRFADRRIPVFTLDAYDALATFVEAQAVDTDVLH